MNSVNVHIWQLNHEHWNLNVRLRPQPPSVSLFTSWCYRHLTPPDLERYLPRQKSSFRLLGPVPPCSNVEGLPGSMKTEDGVGYTSLSPLNIGMGARGVGEPFEYAFISGGTFLSRAVSIINSWFQKLSANHYDIRPHRMTFTKSYLCLSK